MMRNHGTNDRSHHDGEERKQCGYEEETIHRAYSTQQIP
jgi:hypothetical protein